MMRLLIADDHPVFLESLSLLVEKIPGYEVAGKVNNGREVLEYLRHSPVELVLTDIQMPGMGGIELITEMRRLYPDVPVLLLTMLEDTETVKAALKAGAAGYVTKSASVDVFSRALNTVASGGTFYSDEVMQRVEESKEVGVDQLTDREVEIIRLISAGLTSAEISKKLFISVNTVDTHRKNIFSKTGVKNAVGLTHYARKYGIV